MKAYVCPIMSVSTNVDCNLAQCRRFVSCMKDECKAMFEMGLYVESEALMVRVRAIVGEYNERS